MLVCSSFRPESQAPMTDSWDCPNPWPCENHAPHDAPFGCVHHATWAPDRHDTSEAGDQ